METWSTLHVFCCGLPCHDGPAAVRRLQGSAAHPLVGHQVLFHSGAACPVVDGARPPYSWLCGPGGPGLVPTYDRQVSPALIDWRKDA